MARVDCGDERESHSVADPGSRAHSSAKRGQGIVSATSIGSVGEMSDVDAQEWSADELQQAGRLLLLMREAMLQAGIRSIHDRRVSLNVRRLWQRLVNSNAVETLSCKEIGLLWDFVKLSKATEIRYTSAVPRSAVKARRRRQTMSSRRVGQQTSVRNAVSRQRQISGGGWLM